MRRSLPLSTFDPSILRTFLARADRLRDPLVQVWLLVALAFIFGMVSHYRSDRRSGDEKNTSSQSPARLLLGGARVTWSDDFGGTPSVALALRPKLSLRAPASTVLTATDASNFNARPPAVANWKSDAEAAGRLPWRHLDQTARQALNAVPREALPEVPFQTVWSGGPVGNRDLVELHLSRRDVTGTDFVIGNGSRSGDGEIEVCSAWTSRLAGTDARPLRICFVGDGSGEPTAAQRQSVGELLNYLEARFGRLREVTAGSSALLR